MPKGVPKDGLWRGREPVSMWMEREQAVAPQCACGCGDRIIIQPHHRVYGVPKVILGHHVRVRHPRWREDRTTVLGGRGGAYFVASVRECARARARGRCERCGAAAKLEVDHVVPVSEGGDGSLENAQALCHACHTTKTASERRRRRENQCPSSGTRSPSTIVSSS